MRWTARSIDEAVERIVAALEANTDMQERLLQKISAEVDRTQKTTDRLLRLLRAEMKRTRTDPPWAALSPTPRPKGEDDGKQRPAGTRD